MSKKLFLTGAHGMVGKNVLAHPDAQEWTILAPTSSELDLTDAHAVRAFFAAEKPDAVVHAAGKVGGIQANMADPVGFLDINLTIGRNVIMEAHNAGVSQLVNLASTCMYPAGAPNPLTEDMILTAPLEPTNEGYALAKIMATRMCQYISAQDSAAQYKTLIPCNLFGLHDKFDPKHSHLVPAIIHKMHIAKTTGAKTVEIWGDGTARREFMFAADLADAVHRSLGDTNTLPDLMNVGLGHDHTINAYYETVAEIVGWEGRFVHDLSKPVGMKQKLTDTRRQTAWGWSPQTSLKDGLSATYEHYLNEVSK
ncbi:GDP-L-colitose synthase [Ascidiaceihabitans donghaensis]|uniref:GDP-L-fucose synthase n=1 Tax=Ascidiaceihabitans donghaensis TaxID=1510460 RepID=A0A2R8B979_9RHOB|nr:GDP-L-fucose synthase [Ascidiaceihabitans donghaensis]SPH19582.1 GDP-L-colitose synthase [Ascidiaceihabitans donghaensis]